MVRKNVPEKGQITYPRLSQVLQHQTNKPLERLSFGVSFGGHGKATPTCINKNKGTSLWFSKAVLLFLVRGRLVCHYPSQSGNIPGHTGLQKSDVFHSGPNKSSPFTVLLTRNTTGGPPIRAMAVESLRLLPPL